MMMRYNQLCPVTYGSGAVSATGEVCRQLGLEKVLLVSDPTVLELGHTQKAVDSLTAAGVSCQVFSHIETDAPDYTVAEGAEAARAFGAQGIVSIGGGSTLDTGKAIAAFAVNGKTMEQFLDISVPPAPGPQLPVVCIPTTAGTGSENTIVAVITNTTTHWKCGVFAPPTAAIVDPELTLTVPAEVTAYTGMDAFSHCSEVLSSDMVSNPHSDTLAFDGLERIVRWLPVAMKEPGNLEARENLAIASNFAGIAFADAAVHLGHAMAHAMGAHFHIPHGIACAWVTPVIVEYMADARPEKFQRMGRILGVTLSGNVETLGKEVAEGVRALSKSVGIPTCTDLNLTEADLVSCTDYVAKEVMSTFGVKKPDAAKISDLFRQLYACNR